MPHASFASSNGFANFSRQPLSSNGMGFGRAAAPRQRTVRKVSAPMSTVRCGGASHVAHAVHDLPQAASPLLGASSSGARAAAWGGFAAFGGSSGGGAVAEDDVERRFSKFVGVCWNRRARRWASQSRVSGRTVYLGYYVDEEEAARK
jgi:hypothetical protein